MSIAPLGPGAVTTPAEALRPNGASAAEPAPFVQVIENLLNDATAQHAQADQAIRDLALGQTDNIHNVMLAVAKADISFRMILEVRNRLTEAYQEIMKMQV